MKLVDFNLVKESDAVIASVRVVFEDSGRPDKTVYIKTVPEFADGFGVNPDAFLVGCLLPALHLGEKRIFMEQEICPFLKEGIRVAMKIFSHWTDGRYAPILVEAQTRSRINGPETPRAGMVMSGGMDSLAALRLNHMNYPGGHPAQVKDSFFSTGLISAEWWSGG